MNVEDTHAAFYILLASPERVFKEDIENATEAKGGLDDVRGKLANYGRGKTQQSAHLTSDKDNTLDCLKVLRSIVTTSGVRVSSLPSGVVTMVDLWPASRKRG